MAELRVWVVALERLGECAAVAEATVEPTAVGDEDPAFGLQLHQKWNKVHGLWIAQGVPGRAKGSELNQVIHWFGCHLFTYDLFTVYCVDPICMMANVAEKRACGWGRFCLANAAYMLLMILVASFVVLSLEDLRRRELLAYRAM